MSEKGSVFQKGGGGTNFEQSVQTAFLTTLIIRGNAPCLPRNEIIEIAFQTTNRGYETDDLLVIAKSSVGRHRLLAQIKHNLTFSLKNETFKEVINAFWKDYNNASIFDKSKDLLLIIKSGLSKDERNHIKSILNWAKTHVNETDFYLEVNRLKEKKDRLNIFKETLKEANSNKELTDKEVWEFLKCLDILEYDFLNKGSIDETYFLNLIKLSKNNSTSANESEIWNTILGIVGKLNKDGGSVSIESIQDEEFYQYFDIAKLEPYFKSVEKLKSDSEIIIKPLKNTIQDFHIDRNKISELIVESASNFQFTIVTGKPGVGKSAAIKEVLINHFSTANIFVFRADQFNSSHITNVFSKQGINETIQDIFSCISLITEKIIVIDSLEKLLEGDPENAFKQLLAVLKEYPDIKVIASVRKYALDLILQKFGIEKNEFNNIEIQELNDEELDLVSGNFPQVIPVFKNYKLKSLLRSPKYLDFALKSLAKKEEDLSAISITDFKKKLWNNIIEDITTKKDGLARKRNNAFLNIAIKRAKEMKLFVVPDDNLEEGIEALEKDEVIFQEQNEYKFSPTHDILEDWALIKYIDTKYKDFPNPKELFKSLGNEPAVRRAFRLWIEDNLVDNDEKITELINSTIDNNSIEKYWADEILIAIFRSQNSSYFFKTFHEKLIENNGELLNRCIHIIRTACKENNNSSILLPVGSGWTEITYFIKNNIDLLDKYKLSVINFLLDWEYKLLFQSDINQEELIAVKCLVMHFLGQVESGLDIWEDELFSNKSKDLIGLLFNLAKVAKNEIKELIERSITVDEDNRDWRLNSFYEEIIKKCLTGIGSKRLVIELPDTVIRTAWHSWKLRKREEKPDNSSPFRFAVSNKLSEDECWGIEDKFSFFPAGVYKTPIYDLLYYHPIKGLEFVTEFINYSVNFYVKTECEYKYQITQIEIELNDGTIRKQWAAWELWAAYRGMSVTHYALECILMSTEKYLLEMASIKSKISRENIQFCFNYLIKNSNNVAISGMLASIAMAYPEEVGIEMLPILTVEEFYHWDTNRRLQEHSVLSPMDNEISFAQKERHRLNQLKHRTRYQRGISDFIIDYQFNIKTFNKEIHNVFDKLKKKSNPDDILWKKILTEIDIRNFEIGDYDENIGGYPVQPKYDDDVSEFIDDGKYEFEIFNNSLNYSGKILKVHDREEEITFEYWEECYNYYSNDKNQTTIYDRHVSLAIIGLRDLNSDLKDEHRNWCINTIVKTNALILKKTLDRSFEYDMSFNIMEKEISIKAIHLVFKELKTEEEQNYIIGLLIRFLYAPLGDHETEYLVEYLRSIFFMMYPGAAKRIWIGIIEYAKYRKANPRTIFGKTEKEIERDNKKEQEFLDFLALTKDLDINIEDINFDIYDARILAHAFIIIPFNSIDKLYCNFILKLITLVTEDLKFEEDYSYHQNRKSRHLRFQQRLLITKYLTELLIKTEINFAKKVLDKTIAPIYKEDHLNQKYGRNDLFEFCTQILEFTIIKLDDIISNSSDDKTIENLILNFWNLWEYFFEKIKISKKPYFINMLLLGTEWKPSSVHWKALESKKDLYKKMCLELGQNNIKAIIKVLSTIGDKTLLPDGIVWLTEILKENIEETVNLVSPAGERLIKRLFYNHINKIKSNKLLIENYIWILNNMIDLGSSEAYLFRENVITYKSLD